MFLFFRQKWRTTATNGATLCYMYGNCGLHAVSSLLNSSNRPVRWSKKCRWSLNHCKHTPGHLVLFFLSLLFSTLQKTSELWKYTQWIIWGTKQAQTKQSLFYIWSSRCIFALMTVLFHKYCYFYNAKNNKWERVTNIWLALHLHKDRRQ